MAKSKYKLGKFYECERCGNVIKVVKEGGGNVICCVKALNETSAPPGGEPLPEEPPSARQPEPARPATGKPTPAPTSGARKAPPVDPATLVPVDVFQLRESGESGEEVFKKSLFKDDLSEVELLRLLYGQREASQSDANRDSVLSLLEGRGVFYIGNRECQVTTGATVLVPRGVQLGIKNTDPTEMVVLRVFAGVPS
ncbi:MAG: hypothetical protein HY720_07430 [Planctomycetes bacterium]|nr:hypothetical protein [Planctomycetota bacterium]